MDFYSSMDELNEYFRKFVNKVPSFGKSFICLDDKNNKKLIKKFKNKNFYTYGIHPNSNFLIKNINLNIETAILADDAQEREFEKVKDAFLDDGKKVDMTVANELGNDELKMIKDAHYFAVLWQTICKD